jgi:hypothetical protein
MSQFANDDNLIEYEPQIREFGIQSFSDLHEKTYDDIIRLLNIEWFPTAEYGKYDISIIGSKTKLSPSKLTTSQFTRAACYHVLAYYIYPKLSTFDPNGDAFREKMKYYKEKFREEFELILKSGVEYDVDSSGTISDSERQPFNFGRLIR